MPRPLTKAQTPVTFRLPLDLHKKLEILARRRRKSVHEAARAIVEESLDPKVKS